MLPLEAPQVFTLHFTKLLCCVCRLHRVNIYFIFFQNLYPHTPFSRMPGSHLLAVTLQ